MISRAGFMHEYYDGDYNFYELEQEIEREIQEAIQGYRSYHSILDQEEIEYFNTDIVYAVVCLVDKEHILTDVYSIWRNPRYEAAKEQDGVCLISTSTTRNLLESPP